MKALSGVPATRFAYTEDAKTVARADVDKEARDSVKTYKNFNPDVYAIEILRSKYCLHLRGDTTTSRRLYVRDFCAARVLLSYRD